MTNAQRSLQQVPELLAPAGSFDALKAGIGNGADACYLGAGAFNARRQARNFEPEQLKQAIDFAHLRSSKVYLTLNTLLTDDEGSSALRLAGLAYEAGIDAIIVQDIGLAALLHRQLPDLVLHASTQMTLVDESDISEAARLGFQRVVLPRELSLDEIRHLTAAAGNKGLETEVFIHGALCISYSGQCLLSSAIGGRSGNRGECAGPCRLPWHLSANTGIGAYPWLSPCDQSLLSYLPDLADMGVKSLKIEGRMRSPAYVGQVVSVYRELLDSLQSGRNPLADKSAEHGYKRRLLLAFNRGGTLTDRYVSQDLEQTFLSGPYSGSHGIMLGTIASIQPRTGDLQVVLDPDFGLDNLPARQDIISVRDAKGKQEKGSCPIGTIEQRGRILVIRGFHPDVLSEFDLSDPVFIMNSSMLERQALAADRKRTGISINAAQEGDQLHLDARVTDLRSGASDCRASTCSSLSTSKSLDDNRVRKQLSKTGQTPFAVQSIDVSNPISARISEINQARRQLLGLLADKLAASARRTLPVGFSDDWQGLVQSIAPSEPQVDTAGLVSACYHRLPLDLDSIACGADLYLLPIVSLDSMVAPVIVRFLRDQEPDCKIFASLPAASTGKVQELVKLNTRQLDQWGFDGISSGRHGLAGLTAGQLEKLADPGSNLINQASLAYYASRHIQLACLSPEIGYEQAINLSKVRPLSLEWQVYGRIRVMTSAYCPVGQNRQNCQRCHDRSTTIPLPDAAVSQHLSDRLGQAFLLVLHPAACFAEILSHFHLARSQVFSENPGSGLGARLAFTDETPDERRELTQLVKRLTESRTAVEARKAEQSFQAAANRIAQRLGSSCRRSDMTDLNNQEV